MSHGETLKLNNNVQSAAKLRLNWRLNMENCPIKFYEVFKPVTSIPGVDPDRYMISNFGKLFDKKFNRYSKISRRPDGYLSISLNTNGEPKAYLLHRVVALEFVDGDKSLIVNHIDGDKSNPFFLNLEWITHSGNNIHAFAHGLMPKGEDTPLSVITNEQAEEICRCLDEQKLTYAQIAERCGIISPDSSSLISSIRRGVVWRHVSQKYNFSKDYKGKPYTIIKSK